MDFLDKQPKQWNTDMRFGLWNVRSLYRAGSLLTVLRELSRCVTFSGSAGSRMGGDTEPAREYTFFYGKGNENHELGTGFFVHIRESYQQLRGLSLLLIGCHIYNTKRSLVSYHCSEHSCPNRG
jgi:hypothetical protein